MIEKVETIVSKHNSIEKETFADKSKKINFKMQLDT